ncbi:MAG: aldo/keto reductase, partial [Verrucomicrobiales bacterium]|nr:aldo/keto reductase [Verrucomicrobiales bacterium]
MHHLVTLDDVNRALGPGGAVETFRRARESGKIRAIGFSAHSTKAALAALRGFPFDTVMFPISFAEYYLRDFGKAVLEAAAERGAAVIAIKPMCLGAWPPGVAKTRDWWYRTPETVADTGVALRFSLSLKGVVAGLPPSYVDLLDMAITAAKDFRPATTEDREQLRALAKQCVSLFLREDQQPEPPASAALDLPYPDRLHA